MNPTIHEQLETLKRTMACILDGIERLELQLDPEHEANTEEFNAWCDNFDQRWADRNHVCHPLCPDHGDPRDTSIVR